MSEKIKQQMIQQYTDKKARREIQDSERRLAIYKDEASKLTNKKDPVFPKLDKAQADLNSLKENFKNGKLKNFGKAQNSTLRKDLNAIENDLFGSTINIPDCESFIKAINAVRTNPKSYLDELEEQIKNFEDNGKILKYNGKRIETEGKAAWSEAIQFLKKQDPVPALAFSVELSRAAFDHLRFLKKNSKFEHIGSGGLNAVDRLKRYIKFSGWGGECLSDWGSYVKDCLRNLIVCEGAKNRSNRKYLFDKELTVGGGALFQDLGALCMVQTHILD